MPESALNDNKSLHWLSDRYSSKRSILVLSVCSVGYSMWSSLTSIHNLTSTKNTMTTGLPMLPTKSQHCPRPGPFLLGWIPRHQSHFTKVRQMSKSLSISSVLSVFSPIALFEWVYNDKSERTSGKIKIGQFLSTRVAHTQVPITVALPCLRTTTGRWRIIVVLLTIHTDSSGRSENLLSPGVGHGPPEKSCTDATGARL